MAFSVFIRSLRIFFQEIFLFCYIWPTMQDVPLIPGHKPSSETQGQIVGARESLNGRKIWPFWLPIGARKFLCISAQSEGRTMATVWNVSGRTLSPGALLAVLYKNVETIGYLLRKIFLLGSDKTVACIAAGLAKSNCKK